MLTIVPAQSRSLTGSLAEVETFAAGFSLDVTSPVDLPRATDRGLPSLWIPRSFSAQLRRSGGTLTPRRRYPAGKMAPVDLTLKHDAFQPWDLMWACILSLFLWLCGELDRVLNLYLLLVPIVLLPTLVLGTIWVVSFGVNVFRRRWRRSLSLVIAPSLVWLLLFLLVQSHISDLVRLEISKQTYLAQLEALAAEGKPRFKSWDWGETGGAAVVNTFWVLVYDESDGIVKPRSSWPAEWRRNAEQGGTGLYSFLHPGEFAFSAGIVKHLEGHFYVVVQSF